MWIKGPNDNLLNSNHWTEIIIGRNTKKTQFRLIAYTEDLNSFDVSFKFSSYKEALKALEELYLKLQDKVVYLETTNSTFDDPNKIVFVPFIKNAE